VRPNSARSAALAIAATIVLSACGGGGNESGPPDEVVLSQTTLTVKGTKDACALGGGVQVFVFGGTPPYKLSNSLPDYIILDRTEVAISGESFTVGFTGLCIDNMPVVIEDRMGRLATLSVNNVKGE
jgi:hypothetical protein